MDIIRAILDGIMMAVYFNGLAAVFILINSRYFFSSYPKSIQQAAPNPATKEEKKAGAKIMCFLLLPLFLYGAVSAVYAGTSDFWMLFLSGYINWMIVNFGDLIFLDGVLFSKQKSRVMLPGTEDHPDYETKNWMRKLALPEHLLLWPFFIVPFYTLVQTGLALLILHFDILPF